MTTTYRFRSLCALFVSVICLHSPALSAGQSTDQNRTEIDFKAECSYSPYISRSRNFADLVTSADPVVGDIDAPVTVIEYFDPNCGHCKAMHPVMKDIIEKYQDRARFYMVPFVLWEYSLGQIEALYVAAAKGKYYEMLQAQFDNQKAGGLSMNDLRDLAESIDIDPDWLEARVAEGRYQDSILNRRRQIIQKGVTGTPTIMINGRYITESAAKTASCIGQLIEETLVSGD